MARFSASALSSRLLLEVWATEPRRDVDGVDGEAAEEEAEERPAKVSESKLLNVLLGVPGTGAGEGGDGISSVMESVSHSPSEAGKKFWKRPFACHFEAFLNSIQTSIRPGRHRAGSSFSRWFVVLKDIK